MNKNTKKLLTGTTIAVGSLAAAGSVSFALTKYLVEVAMDREVPKSMGKAREHLTGSGTPELEMLEQLGNASKRLEERDMQTLEITSHDGIRLIGHYCTCEDPERIIIAMHGWRSSWTNDFGVISDFWHDNHCNVLYAEQRAQNNSDGEYMGFGMIERYDCLDWINAVNERTGGTLPIYLAGISMGASTVLMAAGLELPDNVHGILADCGYTSPHAIWKHVMENNLHISYGLRGSIANELCRKKIHMGTQDCSAPQALRETKTPVLFIHGTDDHFVPIEMTYENYKACAAPKRLLVVPGAEHGMSYMVDRESYENAVKSFWQDFDSKKSVYINMERTAGSQAI